MTLTGRERVWVNGVEFDVKGPSLPRTGMYGKRWANTARLARTEG
ncbi:hypothetical protein ACWDRR_00645 [Kitasatospora sp. NPDC003701]